MKVGYITVNKTKYPACLSTRVIINIKEKTGKNFADGIDDLLSSDNYEGLFWLMSQMLNAGAKYNKLIGVDYLDPPAEDELMDLVGVDDYANMMDIITSVAVDTSTPEVQIEGDEKNAKTTNPTA